MTGSFDANIAALRNIESILFLRQNNTDPAHQVLLGCNMFYSKSHKSRPLIDNSASATEHIPARPGVNDVNAR
jgi:hypothetical protein